MRSQINTQSFDVNVKAIDKLIFFIKQELDYDRKNTESYVRHINTLYSIMNPFMLTDNIRSSYEYTVDGLGIINGKIIRYIFNNPELKAMLHQSHIENILANSSSYQSRYFWLANQINNDIKFDENTIEEFFYCNKKNYQLDNIIDMIKKNPNELMKFLSVKNINHMFETAGYCKDRDDVIKNFFKERTWLGDNSIAVFLNLQTRLSSKEFIRYLFRKKNGELVVFNELRAAIISFDETTVEEERAKKRVLMVLLRDPQMRSKLKLSAEEISKLINHYQGDQELCNTLIRSREVYEKIKNDTNKKLVEMVQSNIYLRASYAIHQGIDQTNGGFLGRFEEKEKKYLRHFINHIDLSKDPLFNTQCELIAENENYWKHIAVKPKSSGWFFGLIGKRTDTIVEKETKELARKNKYFADKIYDFKYHSVDKLINSWLNDFNTPLDSEIQKMIEERLICLVNNDETVLQKISHNSNKLLENILNLRNKSTVNYQDNPDVSAVKTTNIASKLKQTQSAGNNISEQGNKKQKREPHNAIDRQNKPTSVSKTEKGRYLEVDSSRDTSTSYQRFSRS